MQRKVAQAEAGAGFDQGAEFPRREVHHRDLRGGVPDEDVQRAVSMGVCKVNFATELRAAYTQALRDCLAHDAALYDPKKYGGPAREAVISLVRHRIKICAGKVGLIAPL